MYVFHRTLDSSWHFDDHCNDYNRLYFILDGHGKIFNDEESVHLLPGNIYMIPADSHYNYRCEDHLEKIFLHFHLRIMPGRDVLSNIKRIVKIESSVDEIEKIKDMCYTEDIMSAMFFQNYIRSLTAKILEPYSDHINRELDLYMKYEPIYNYVENNLYADTKVSDICRHIGFSQTYIGQKFKQDTGITIKQLISDMLLEKMKNSLIVSGSSVKEISEELHFSSEFYFSKFFKKRIGISPREFKKRHSDRQISY